MLGGCGGGGTSTPTTTTSRASAEQQLFVLKCGACHKLDDAGTTGTFGSDLDKLQPSRDEVLKAIKDGPGAMPENIVTGADAETLAAYVARVAGQ